MLPSDKAIMTIARIVMGLAFLYFGLSKLFAINGITGFIGTKLPLPAVVF